MSTASRTLTTGGLLRFLQSEIHVRVRARAGDGTSSCPARGACRVPSESIRNPASRCTGSSDGDVKTGRASNMTVSVAWVTVTVAPKKTGRRRV